MKRKFVLLLALLASLSLAGLTLASVLQTPTIKPEVIAGGGGHFAQNDVTINNTLGQTVTGVDSAGALTLCTGYWCGVEASIDDVHNIYLPLTLKSA